jgi:hypothetical protein
MFAQRAVNNPRRHRLPLLFSVGGAISRRGDFQLAGWALHTLVHTQGAWLVGPMNMPENKWLSDGWLCQ